MDAPMSSFADGVLGRPQKASWNSEAQSCILLLRALETRATWKELE